MKIYGAPNRRTGRPRFYFDTSRAAFYTVPSRKFPRSRKVDPSTLMGLADSQANFRVDKRGNVIFKGAAYRGKRAPAGVKIGYNVRTDKDIPKRLRTRGRRDAESLRKGVPVRLRRYPETAYNENVLARNPQYILESFQTNIQGEIEAVYRSVDGAGVFAMPLRGEVREVNGIPTYVPEFNIRPSVHT